jgi:hypothetical protein
MYCTELIREISAPAIEERQIREAVERLRQIITEQLTGLNVRPVVRSDRPVDEIIKAQNMLALRQ